MSGSVKMTWEPQRAIDWLTENGKLVLVEAAEHCLMRYLSYAPVDTGAMIASARINPVNDFHIQVLVGGGVVNYAAYVEFGHMTRAGTWVPPNPAMRLALDDTATAFPQIAAKIFRT